MIASFGGGVQAVLALLVVLIIIVTVHEFGHYIIGRLCGIHAEVFSLGFGRPIWSRIDSQGTRWQVAMIPLGGYVRFMGDADAASRPGALPSGLTEEEKRHTMQGAPLWARSATVIAGPAFNVILTLAVFFGLILYSGIGEDAAIVGSVQTVPGVDVPLQVGDLIVSMDGTATPDMAATTKLAKTLKDEATVTYVVERNGQTLTFDGPNPVPPVVQSVNPSSAGAAAGLQTGDLILTLDGHAIAGFDQMPPLVEASQGNPIALTIRRGDQTLNLTLTPRRVDLPNAEGGFDTRWLIGVTGTSLFGPTMRSASLTEAASLAAKQSWYMAKTNLNGIVQVVKGTISRCNVSGPIGMAKVAAAAVQSGLETFIGTLALMSLTIGLANLLPIPVLDGGHLLFHIYEAVVGRPPSDRALQVLMSIGFAVLIALMLFAFSNDLFLCN
ncbi:MAG: RIP metalloprotease RseP [bacterium]